jgi:hypothetical protein
MTAYAGKRAPSTATGSHDHHRLAIRRAAATLKVSFIGRDLAPMR